VWLRHIPHKVRIIMPHRSNTYIHVAYCYRPSSVSVGLSLSHTNEPYKTAEAIELPFGLSTQAGPSKYVLHKVQIHPWEAQFSGGNWRTIAKYGDTLRSSVKKWLNRSICRLHGGLEWADGCTSSIIFARWRQCAFMGGHIITTRQMRLNHPSTAALRIITNYFDHLLSLDTPTIDSHTDSRALRAKYCIVSIPHNPATCAALEKIMIFKK